MAHSPWKRRIAGATFILAACLSAASVRADRYENTAQLWAGFDPRADPLDARVLSETTADGIVCRVVQYSSETSQGFTVRMVGYYAFPTGAKGLPAVLHIHGGGQNAIAAYVRYWAQHGYAALSIDWGGRPLAGKPPQPKTEWGGPLPYNQNKNDAHTVYNLSPDARSNAWYHWAIAARRSVTFLEQQPEVDPSRIGAYGISMGGDIMWLLAGTDRRLRCAVDVVGLQRHDELLHGIPGSEYEPAARANPIWGKTIDPKAYAQDIACPFFFLSAANDYHARIDLVDETLAEIPGGRHWQSYSPHFSHHIGIEFAPALPAWMDWWLKNGPAWPRSPELRADLAGSPGRFAVRLRPDRAIEVSAVTVLYSTGAFPQSRFWRNQPARRDGAEWRAELPLTATDAAVIAYANVTYQFKLVLSTQLVRVEPAALATAGVTASDPATLVIDDFRNGGVDWFVPDTGPNVLLSENQYFRIVDRPGISPALTWNEPPTLPWRFFTRKVGDPKWRGPAGAALRFSIRAEQPNTVSAFVAENFESPPLVGKVYAASAHLAGGRWETVVLPLAQFHSLHGGPSLANWDQVDELGIVGKYNFSGGHMRLANRVVGESWQGPPPEIADVRWIQP